MGYLFHKIKTISVPYWLLILFLVNAILCYMFYATHTTHSSEAMVKWIPFTTDNNKFLIYNSKCQIPDIDPWNEEVTPFYRKEKFQNCTQKELLTEIRKRESHSYLTINEQAIKFYCEARLTCCYSTVIRDTNAEVPDNKINISECKYFTDEVQIQNDVVLVHCYCVCNNTKEKVYSNTHAIIIVSDKLKEKRTKYEETAPPSVLFIGLDSVSRLNFARSLPSTLEYLISKNWTDFRVYNKVGLNTFPNLMALFTGLNFTAINNSCDPYATFFDSFDTIFKLYERFGYVTGFAEDLAEINTFNYKKQGFARQPTDFYFRHYTMATDQLETVQESEAKYCAGPEVYAMRILNIATDFALTFRDQASLGFFWINTCSHDNMNAPSKLDQKFVAFFENLIATNITDNTIIIFFSDHGFRFEDFRLTSTGWLEVMMPALFVWLPDSFKQVHADKYQIFLKNSKRLTTPFDLYMTLQDLLVLSGLNYTAVPSVSCPKCKSLFSEIEDVRSCQDAGIHMYWCPCVPYKEFNSSHALVGNIADFVLTEIKGIMLAISPEASKCASLKLRKILRCRISDWDHKVACAILLFETEPRMLFEVRVKLARHRTKTDFFLDDKGVERIDLYKIPGSCVDNEDLKKYCYCE